MSSSVFFKFKSQKEPQRVTFDGTGISVFELKRDIISISRLGDGSDFDLAIYNVDSNEEYNDDTTIISRGTTVVARRLPAARPGAGRAARYVSGKMPVTAKNQHRVEATKNGIQSRTPATTMSALANNASEEDKIAAMFQQGGEVWEQQQQQMANQKAIHRTGYVKPQAVPDKPLPVGYTCHRCGEKGHWIQACPTNNDPTFDNRPKFRKTTGIPRSFLKVVDKPTGLATDGSVDMPQLPAGVMYTANGEWVIAEPDKASWDQYQAKTKALADKAENSVDSEALRELGLECPIDQRMFVDPVKTPCCERTYCRECIENALLSSDFVCPGCSTDGVLVDNLVEDEEADKKIAQYLESLATEKAERAKSASPDPDAVTGTPKKSSGSEGPDTPLKDVKEGAKSPEKESTSTDQPSAEEDPKSPSSVNLRKRRADSDLEQIRIPTAPAAMRQQQQMQEQLHQQQQQPPNPPNMQNMSDFVQQMNAMAGQTQMPFMPAFPMMPPLGMNSMMMMNPMGGFPGMPGMMNGGGFNNGHLQQQWQQGGQHWNHGQGRGQGWQGNQRGRGGQGGYMRQSVNGQYQNRGRGQH